MTKKKVWQIAGISFLCVCVLAVGVLGVVFGMNHTSEPVNLANADKQDEIIECEMTYSNGIELFMSSAPVVNGDTLEQTITATVLPEDSNNKLVDWSVSWQYTNQTFESSHTVTDYVTITPQSDGSNVATVSVHQAFADHPVFVKVTTREGGFTAICIVKYVGIPDSMNIDLSSLSDGDVLANTITTLDINFDNLFGVVTDEYVFEYANFNVTVTPHGSFTAIINHLDLNNLPLDSASEITVNLEDVADVISLSAKVETGKLVITSTGSVASYHIDKIVDASGTGLPNYREVVSYLSGAENCYWDITIKDIFSGLAITIQVGIYSNNQSVSMNSSSLIF